ncbi:MAG: MFS transporter [Chloroflexi bacterium]|nr:MFS transporter [Chloroflexota bacterium]
MASLLTKIQSTYREFPQTFWVLTVASFIDRLGGTLIFPFFSLYITQKFNVGLSQAGVLLGIFSISSLVGSMIGGGLTDKFGRRNLVLFGLIVSALSSLSMGLVNDLNLFYILAVFVGLFSDVSGPAYQAMIADILEEDKRAEGYGMLRVVMNMAWIVGPAIGGLLASRSFLLLFILDAITSLITAAIVYRMIPETKPQTDEDAESVTLLQTMQGYMQVFSDKLYTLFILISILIGAVYMQMYSSLSVFLRDVYGIPAQGFGALISINAGTVVVLQFWVTRKTKRYPIMLMMALGTAFYLVGFTAYGFVSTYTFFLIAMLVITVGEMITVPLSQTIAARFAPEDMRGRYMAVFGLSWAIPSTFAPWAAGMIMDNYDPNWIWYSSGILAGVAILGYFALHLSTKELFSPSTIMEGEPSAAD